MRAHTPTEFYVVDQCSTNFKVAEALFGHLVWSMNRQRGLASFFQSIPSNKQTQDKWVSLPSVKTWIVKDQRNRSSGHGNKGDCTLTKSTPKLSCTAWTSAVKMISSEQWQSPVQNHHQNKLYSLKIPGGHAQDLLAAVCLELCAPYLSVFYHLFINSQILKTLFNCFFFFVYL